MYQDIHKKLLSWYQKHGRNTLPWRNNDNPYHIYLSEIMLQQTQVKTVLERFYFPFLKAFPTLEDLAKAPEEKVLKMWEGLGYYNRAKNLHKCAKLTQPTLPQTYEQLLALPGIGKNTASAICAFAYHQPYPVMEANIKRVLCRIHTIETPKDEALRTLAMEMLDTHNPYDYNQAMMDIGSLVCTVKSPNCALCPFASICKAYHSKHYTYPLKKKKSIPTKERTILIQEHNKHYYLEKRKGKFLSGLWGFPLCEKPLPPQATYLAHVTHTYSHFKFTACIYIQTLSHIDANYFNYEEIQDLAISGVDKKILKLLQ